MCCRLFWQVELDLVGYGVINCWNYDLWEGGWMVINFYVKICRVKVTKQKVQKRNDSEN